MDLNCELCNGTGMVNGWANADGDYDFEWCDCNPQHLTEDMLDVCMRCNENKVTMLELYCLNCYVALNSEIDYDSLDKLWLSVEAN